MTTKICLAFFLATSLLLNTTCITFLNPTVSPICEECKLVVGSIQNVMVGVNKTYEEIIEKNLDENVCGNLPLDAQVSCKSIVEKEIPAIWSSIINEYLDPVQTCTSNHFCKESMKSVGFDPVTCHICKRTAQFIDASIFEDPLVQKKVATKLKIICTQLPKAANSTIAECEKLIDADTGAIMTELGRVVATELCRDLQMCPPLAVAASSPVCRNCAALVNRVQAVVAGPGSVARVLRDSVASLVCDKLPAEQAAACGEAAAAATGRAAAAAARAVDQRRVCGWCDGVGKGWGAGDGLTCHVCQKVAVFLDEAILEDPTVQKDIAKEIKEVCAQLPNPRVGNSSITAECDKLVDDNVGAIMNNVGKVVSERLCEDLAVCS